MLMTVIGLAKCFGKTSNLMMRPASLLDYYPTLRKKLSKWQNNNNFIILVSDSFISVGENGSLPRRGLFVLWGGWGERKRERAGLPIVPRALSIFSIIDILMGIPSGSLCGGESENGS